MTSNNNLYGNRQQAGVLTGRTGTVNQPNNQPQQNNQQQPANLLQQMAGTVARLSGSMQNGSNSGGSIYNFNTGTSHNFQALMGLDENMAEEQIKQNALNEAAALSNQILQVCSRRNANHPAYQQLRAAFERFKSPRRGAPQDPALVGFINEIDSNQNLYAVIVLNSCLVFASRWASMLTQDDGSLRSNQAKFKEVMYASYVDTVNFQYLDYLANHPNGAQVYYQFSPLLKEHLMTFEANNFESMLSTFVYAGQQCPWRKGRIEEITQRTNVSNPLLDIADPIDLGFGGHFHNPNDFIRTVDNSQIPNSVVGTVNDPNMREFLLRQRQHYAGEQAAITQHQSEFQQNFNYNDIDAKPLELCNMTAENRLRYTVGSFAVLVPGSDWYLADPEKLRHVLPLIRLSNGDKVDYAEIAYIWRGVLVYRFDWENGIFDFRKINIPDRGCTLKMLLNNPEKLLPYMYVEDGVQKTTFDPSVFEVSKFANDGNINVGDVKEMKNKPVILVGSRPAALEGDNDDTIDKLKRATGSVKGKADGFVLPANMATHLRLDGELESVEKFYNDFAPMIHGAYTREGYTDTGRVIRAIKAGYQQTEHHEAGNLFRDYITSLVNRWFVECRGYSESHAEFERTGVVCVTITNAFADLDELLEWMHNNDQASLRAFLDYETNWFIRTGLEIITPKETAYAENKAMLEAQIDGEDDYLGKLIASNQWHDRVIFRRESMIIEMTKAAGPANVDKVVLKESTNPGMFSIVREAKTIVSKHFDDQPQVLVKFAGNDQMWVLTPSDIDKECVMTMRALFVEQPYGLPLTVCEASPT